MKYQPKYSNFTEIQSDVAERLLDVHGEIEAIKDVIAEEIDAFVEAIMKEQLEEAHVWTVTHRAPALIDVMFSAGEKKLDNGIDLFARQIPLIDIIEEFNWWDELGEYEPKEIRALADRIQVFVDKIRATADKTERENAEHEARWAAEEERLRIEKGGDANES
jgi:hypothetical protein